MLKKLLFILSIFISPIVSAEIRPYMKADVGYADTDFDSGIYFDIGGGVQFNDNIEFELSYNDYNDIGPYGIEITSISYGLNFGGKVSENTRLFAIFGAERLDADDKVRVGAFEIEVDKSSTEAFFGVGAAFQQGDNFDLRTKLVSHDSGDLITINVGFALYF